MNVIFDDFFQAATGIVEPYPYQRRLATGVELPELLDVPTGLGKTAAAVLAWLFRRRFHSDQSVRNATPRRLVYCLPMRVLVEQTHAECIRWLDRLGMLAGRLPAAGTAEELNEKFKDEFNKDPRKFEQLFSRHRELGRRALWDDPEECLQLRFYSPYPETEEQVQGWARPRQKDNSTPSIAVHLLMGGEERTDWAMWPERDAILIGTQDMLLSRALNRGYAAGRARWPMEFGLLNSDCLWVFDEVQIMGSGLATSLQLDAWRGSLELRSNTDGFFQPVSNPVANSCRSLWMSATMASHWLTTAVDWRCTAVEAWNRREMLRADDRADPRVKELLRIQKSLPSDPLRSIGRPATKEGQVVKADADRIVREYVQSLAAQVAEEFMRTNGLTLVILNTVERAKGLFEELRSLVDAGLLRLVHSRFRPMERDAWWKQGLFDRRNRARRLIISTQVVEAGVDFSAQVLFTELAPWASLVQRFGRCARYPGESGRIFWINFDLGPENRPSDHFAKPYDLKELVKAADQIRALSGDAGLAALQGVKDQLDDLKSAPLARFLLPYNPKFIPRKKDLFDLFDTTPDLTGADVDISRFIRDDQELDLQVFWREIDQGGFPPKKTKPLRDELCPVTFYRFKEQAQFKALRKAGRIWRWNYRRGWEPLDSDNTELIFPGQVFLLERSCGGYDETLGWTGNPEHNSFPVLSQPAPRNKTSEQDAEEDAEDLSEAQWLSIADHTRHVCQKLDTLLDKSLLPDQFRTSWSYVLRLAARWHDRGKAHLAFQAKLKPEMLESEEVQRRLQAQPAAKAPDGTVPGQKNRDPVKDAWRPPLRPGARVAPSVPSADLHDKNAAYEDKGDKRRPGFRHELASALALLETLRRNQPDHLALAWPDGLDKCSFGTHEPATADLASDVSASELASLSADDFDLLLYLVACHHGKVRMSLRSSPDDGRDDVPDPCPANQRQARGVRDNDPLKECKLPAADFDNPQADMVGPEIRLSLDPMELGLSLRYGASWRERVQRVLERIGPFRLAYLESLLRAADCRASAEEDCVAEDVVPATAMVITEAGRS